MAGRQADELLLAERLVVEGLAAPWAVAVPLHSTRLKQRGFNQSELLARELRNLNESLNALAYAALGQSPQVRRRAG